MRVLLAIALVACARRSAEPETIRNVADSPSPAPVECRTGTALSVASASMADCYALTSATSYDYCTPRRGCQSFCLVPNVACFDMAGNDARRYDGCHWTCVDAVHGVVW